MAPVRIDATDAAFTAKEVTPEGVTWDQMIKRLLELFESEEVNIDEIKDLLSAYHSNSKDWSHYSNFDEFSYTRNLVHEGNDKFNLMLLCWAKGSQSPIHDHGNAHCFVKVLDGSLRETRYEWPTATNESTMAEKEQNDYKINDLTYMSDQLGLHRMENPRHNNDKAVSLHLYSPPFQSCNVFDESTGKRTSRKMTFTSKFGECSPADNEEGGEAAGGFEE